MNDNLPLPDWLDEAPPPDDTYPPELLEHAEDSLRQHAAREARATPQPSARRGFTRIDPERLVASMLAAQQRGEERRAREQHAARELRSSTCEVRRTALYAGLRPWLARIGCPLDLRAAFIHGQHIPHALADWARRFRARPEGHALLAGSVGTGKSTAALWLLRQLYLQRIGDDPDPAWQPPDALWISCGTLYQHVFAKRADLLERYTRCAVLVIDDLGIAYETAWPLAEIDRIVETRHQAQRTCIVTTNLLPTPENAAATGRAATDSLGGRYPRTFSRLCDKRGPGLVRMVGPDLRKPGAQLKLV